MVPKVVKDIVFEMLKQGQNEETAILRELSQTLEDRYPGAKLEVYLEKMGIPTTDKLIDCIRLSTIEYKLSTR